MAEPSLANEAMHKFLLIHRHLRQYAHQMDERGIRPKQFSVLHFLVEHGPATVSEVQDYLYNSASTTSALLAQMEQNGFVTRTRSSEDNRIVIIALTEKGQAVAKDSPMGGIPLLRRRLRHLPANRLERINAALADIMELIEVEDTE